MSDAIPRYIAKTFHAEVDYSTANTNLDGTTGTYATLHTWTSLANEGKGGLIDAIGYKYAASTTAGMFRIFLNDDLLAEIDVAAATVGATVQGASGFIDKTDATYGYLFPLPCKPGDEIKVSTHEGVAGKAWMVAGAYSEKESV